MSILIKSNRKKISDVIRWLNANRQSGTTSLIKKIASENDVYVLVSNKEEASIYGHKAVPIYNIESKISDTKIKKPILVDASILSSLLKLASLEIDYLAVVDNKKSDLIAKIKEEIESYDNESI